MFALVWFTVIVYYLYSNTTVIQAARVSALMSPAPSAFSVVSTCESSPPVALSPVSTPVLSLATAATINSGLQTPLLKSGGLQTPLLKSGGLPTPLLNSGGLPDGWDGGVQFKSVSAVVIRRQSSMPAGCFVSAHTPGAGVFSSPSKHHHHVSDHIDVLSVPSHRSSSSSTVLCYVWLSTICYF